MSNSGSSVAMPALDRRTTSSWMRLNLGVPLRSLQERLDAVEGECRALAALKTEEQDQIAHLQSRLHALAQAVSELPEVFQEALKEVAAQQARVEANVELTRQITEVLGGPAVHRGHPHVQLVGRPAFGERIGIHFICVGAE